jgi:tetratricopeptide (TPR) repeat protein
MRKLILVVLVVLVVAGGGGAGWYVLRHFLHDAIASGEALYAKGDIHGATLEFRNAVRNHPEDARAHVLLAKAQLKSGDAVAAEKELKQARTLGYPGPDLLPLLAKAYMGEARFLDLLRDIPVGTLPPEQEALVLVARSLAQTALGDMPSARASATAAERLDPKLADAPLAEARILSVNGDRVQALLKVDDALKLDPTLLEALGLKADLLREQGDLEQALTTLDRAIDSNPMLPRVRVARGRLLLLLGQDDKANLDLDAALKAEPKNALARYLKGLLLVRAKDWQGADLAFQKIQPVLSQLPRGDYYYALVKSNINQLEQAAEQIAHYVARSPQDPNGFRLLARIDLLLHKQVEANEALKRVAALGGTANDLPVGASAEVRAAAAGADSPEALTHLASEQMGQGDNAGAERDLEQSLESKPQPADTGATQVLSALAAADLDRAKAALDRFRADPNADPLALANLSGLLLMANLDFPGAQAVWEEAAKKWPTAASLKINLARVLELTDHPAESEKVLASILTAQPAQSAALRMMVEALNAHQRVPEAIAYVRAARAVAPSALPLLVTEAALHALAHDFSAAYAVLDEVPLEQAQSPALLNVRSEIQLAQGRVKDSEDSLRQILLTHPEDQGTRQRLVRMLAQSKPQEEEALRLAREGLSLAPGNSSMMQLVVLLVNATQGMEAAQTEVATLRRDPVNLPAARLLKGMLYVTVKQFDDAVAAYREELKTEPFNFLVIAAATAMANAGHQADAVTLLRDWVATQPDATVSDQLAAIDITQRHYDLAEKSLTAVIAERPNDAVALNNIAWIYQHKGDPRALATAKKAYLLQPTAQSADTLGWILLEQGNTHVGLLLVRRAAASMPGDPSVLYHFAYGLNAGGDREAALKLLDAVLKTPVKFDERDAATKLQADLGGPLPSDPAAPAAPAPIAPTSGQPLK